MKDFLRWKHCRKGRFGPESQVDVLMSVLDDKNFKEAKQGQFEDEGVEDDFAAAWQIVTGSVLPHEYKAKAELKAFVIDTSNDRTAEALVVPLGANEVKNPIFCTSPGEGWMNGNSVGLDPENRILGCQSAW